MRCAGTIQIRPFLPISDTSGTVRRSIPKSGCGPEQTCRGLRLSDASDYFTISAKRGPFEKPAELVEFERLRGRPEKALKRSDGSRNCASAPGATLRRCRLGHRALESHPGEQAQDRGMLEPDRPGDSGLPTLPMNAWKRVQAKFGSEPGMTSIAIRRCLPAIPQALCSDRQCAKSRLRT